MGFGVCMDFSDVKGSRLVWIIGECSFGRTAWTGDRFDFIHVSYAKPGNGLRWGIRGGVTHEVESEDQWREGDYRGTMTLEPEDPLVESVVVLPDCLLLGSSSTAYGCSFFLLDRRYFFGSFSPVNTRVHPKRNSPRLSALSLMPSPSSLTNPLSFLFLAS